MNERNLTYPLKFPNHQVREDYWAFVRGVWGRREEGREGREVRWGKGRKEEERRVKETEEEKRGGKERKGNERGEFLRFSPLPSPSLPFSSLPFPPLLFPPLSSSFLPFPPLSFTPVSSTLLPSSFLPSSSSGWVFHSLLRLFCGIRKYRKPDEVQLSDYYVFLLVLMMFLSVFQKKWILVYIGDNLE